MRAVGSRLHDGRPLSVSQAWLHDGSGARVAFSTSTCYVLPPLEGIEPPADPRPYVEPAYDQPDPYLREPSGATIPWEEWRKMSGLEILRGQVAGSLPQPPIHYLTGMTLSEVAEGRAAFSMPAGAWLTSPLGTVQGGAIAMLAHAALATAVTTTLEPGTAYRPVDVKVNFLRPVFPSGQPLVARGAVGHRGRTIAVAGADVAGPDGKKVATATGSTMILPERAAP